VITRRLGKNHPACLPRYLGSGSVAQSGGGLLFRPLPYILFDLPSKEGYSPWFMVFSEGPTR
jgi:hypothetical protein